MHFCIPLPGSRRTPGYTPLIMVSIQSSEIAESGTSCTLQMGERTHLSIELYRRESTALSTRISSIRSVTLHRSQDVNTVEAETAGATMDRLRRQDVTISYLVSVPLLCYIGCGDGQGSEILIFRVVRPEGYLSFGNF
jgi:hypothetical protein